MTLRTFSNAVNVVCPGCGRLLDATDPRLTVIQEANKKFKVTPLIPLGTRGKWKDVTYEVVGFQERSEDPHRAAQMRRMIRVSAFQDRQRYPLLRQQSGEPLQFGRRTGDDRLARMVDHGYFERVFCQFLDIVSCTCIVTG